MARHHRKVVHIAATDSPNVQLAQREIAAGLAPSNRIVVPGILTWEEYQHRLETWDEVRQCIGLRGEFYEGAQLLLFPPDWLDEAERNWNLIKGCQRQARAIGCDPGEGGANSSWSVIDDLGVIEVRSEKTRDTTDIVEVTVDLMNTHGVVPEMVGFDRGGGGKQHADRLRAMGHHVRTIGFGSAPTLIPKRGKRMIEEKIDKAEEAYAYVNLRVQMYHELSQLLDPALNRVNELPGFAIPPGVTCSTGLPCHQHKGQCLRAQLACLPKATDGEGRYKLPSKNKKDENSKERCLVDIISHSPDEADSLVVAVHCLKHKVRRAVAGAF